jgi:antitoxin (DNA-binding transcriptional repressor) of toxin-antitoxin stability system
MKAVTIHKAKSNLSKLIEKACRGEEIVIARGVKPVVPCFPSPLPRVTASQEI